MKSRNEDVGFTNANAPGSVSLRETRIVSRDPDKKFISGLPAECLSLRSEMAFERERLIERGPDGGGEGA